MFALLFLSIFNLITPLIPYYHLTAVKFESKLVSIGEIRRNSVEVPLLLHPEPSLNPSRTMSYIEAPEKTVLRFSETWSEQTSSNRLIANLISINKETNREADTYHFWVKNGILVDPETDKPILDSIIPGVEKDVATKLQAWAIANDEGLAFWISPPLSGVYPCAKAILHRIAYTSKGEKVVLNSAILFDAKLENLETLRQTLFTQPDTEENISKVLEWITKKSDRQITVAKNEIKVRQNAAYFADMVRRGIPKKQVIEEMKRSGFLGPNSISCPGVSTTFSKLTDSRSSITILGGAQEWHSGTCRICGSSTWVGPCSICKPCESKV